MKDNNNVSYKHITPEMERMAKTMFNSVFPKLSEQSLERLVYIAEGMQLANTDVQELL